MEKAERMDRIRGPRRRLGLLWALGALAAVSILFYWRQNFAGQIGGEMSVPKLLWLDYALIAWFLAPFSLCRSPLVAPALRRIYRAHLVSFAIRGAVELWMLYVTVSWLPPYGIAHDLFTIALITALLCSLGEGGRGLNDPVNRAALRFLTSIRLGLGCEILFAWLFYRATGGRIGIYFASADAAFSVINGLTCAALLMAYPDLLRTLRDARAALFPHVAAAGEREVCHG